MPLQNRVHPSGAIHAVAARGMFTGNRGVLHDPDTKSLTARRWTTKAWIICRCDFRGRRRDVMGRNARSGGAGWTELFFMDEVTALAAGHRPCFECRRERARDFARRLGEGLGIAAPKAGDQDAILHAERQVSGRGAWPVGPRAARTLPAGTMVAVDGAPMAIAGGALLPWGWTGYQASTPFPAGRFLVLTPPATVRALGAGYRPAWHPTALALAQVAHMPESRDR